MPTSEDTPLQVLVSHFHYLADRMGVDRVAIGSDFDGATIPAACMGLFLSSLSAGAHLFSSSVSLFDLKSVSSPRPTSPRRCRAQGLSRLAVAPTLRRAPIIARPYLDGSERGSTLVVVGMTLSRGARLVGARIAPHACIRRVSYDPNHDAVMRIGSKLRGGGPILSVGIKAMLPTGTPPPRPSSATRRKAC